MEVEQTSLADRPVFWSSSLALLARLEGRSVSVFVGSASSPLEEALTNLIHDRAYVPRPVRDGLLQLMGLLVEENFDSRLRVGFDSLVKKLKSLERVKVGERKLASALGRLTLRQVAKSPDQWSKFWQFDKGTGQLALRESYKEELEAAGACSFWIDQSIPSVVVFCNDPNSFSIPSELKEIVLLRQFAVLEYNDERGHSGGDMISFDRFCTSDLEVAFGDFKETSSFAKIIASETEDSGWSAKFDWNTGVGTLGGFIYYENRAAKKEEWFGFTAAHVLSSVLGQKTAEEPFKQSYMDNSTLVALLTKPHGTSVVFYDPRCDVAVLACKSGKVPQKPRREALPLGVPVDFNFSTNVDWSGSCLPGDVVLKVGFKTHLTSSVSVPAHSGDRRFEDCLYVQNTNDARFFSQPGDSGALIVRITKDGMAPVGIHRSKALHDDFCVASRFDSFLCRLVEIKGWCPTCVKVGNVKPPFLSEFMPQLRCSSCKPLFLQLDAESEFESDEEGFLADIVDGLGSTNDVSDVDSSMASAFNCGFNCVFACIFLSFIYLSVRK